jgi:hypothetical protein
MPEARHFSMPSTEVGAEVLELLTMGAIVHPATGTRIPLTSRNDRGMADDGDQLAVASRLDPDDAKAILGILVGDALDQPGKHLPVRWLRLRLHGLHVPARLAGR